MKKNSIKKINFKKFVKRFFEGIFQLVLDIIDNI